MLQGLCRVVAVGLSLKDVVLHGEQSVQAFLNASQIGDKPFILRMLREVDINTIQRLMRLGPLFLLITPGVIVCVDPFCIVFADLIVF